MKNLQNITSQFLLVLLLVLTLAGCSQEAKKTRFLKNAGSSFAEGKYDEAEIGYKNALKIDALNPTAISALGQIYAEQGRIGQALPFLIKAHEIDPNNLGLRLKYAQVCLGTGNLGEARTEATFILERRPQDSEAPLILAATLTKPQDIAIVRKTLESLPAPASSGAPALTALGTLATRQGNLPAAEALFQKALAADTKFAAAHAGLASLYWFKQDKARADESFRLAAEFSPARSQRRIQYAQFKIQTGDRESAKRMLTDMTRNTPDFLTPWLLLAEISLNEKDFKTCAGYLEKILTRDSQNLEGLFTRGRLYLAQGDVAKSISEFERLIKMYPRAPLVHYQLGLAYLAIGNASSAANSLRQTLNLMPGQPDATVALANLQLRTGDPSMALVLLKPLLQQQPRNIQVRFLLAEANRMQKNFEEALKIYRQAEADFPGNPQTSLLTGYVLMQLNQPAEARRAFEEALARSPGLVPALERLTALDTVEQKLDDAVRRVETELARNPASAGAHTLLAKICITKNDTKRAVDELRKAIELQPESTEACYLLAQLFMKSNEDEKALDSLQTVVGKNPRDTGAWMLIAQIHEQRQNYPAARDAYDRIIAANPRLGFAYNNLACLYSDYLNDLEKALAAAQKARELLPQEPHAADTLAWIAFKKGQYRWALSLLEESAEKLHDSPVVLFHLGMARYMLGLDEPARLAFQQALDLKKDFAELSETHQRLALLAVEPATATTENRALLEKAIRAKATDPVALMRLAALQEKDGSSAQAIATLQKAASANPENPMPLVQLARIFARSQDTAKALDAARAARKIAPENAEVARNLGQIAYQSGDYDWAASLLQEAAQKLPGDIAVQYETALALYSIGRVSEATSSMQSVLQQLEAKPLVISQNSPNAAQARVFLEMVELSQSPNASASSKIQDALAADPNSVPALMAAAALDEQQGRPESALQNYAKALKSLPDFLPAKVHLAAVAATQPVFDGHALELAQQARALLPNDNDLARALGILLQRKGGEASRAIAFLKQAALAKPNDAELLYYLGAAQMQTKDAAGARVSLQKAIDSGLKPELAAEARKILAGSK